MRKKREMWTYCFYDYAGVTAHLERMSEKGWVLEKAGTVWWTYRQAEPKKRGVAVTYFAGASEFDAGPTPKQRTFLDYCEEAGWHMAAQWLQMDIFYSEDPGAVPLETDEGVKLNTIHQAMKKNFLPSQAVMVVLSILQIWMQTHNGGGSVIQVWSNGMGLWAAAMWALLLANYVMSLAGYALWYRASQKSVERGGACVVRGAAVRRTSLVLMVVALGSLAAWLAYVTGMGNGWIAGPAFLYVAAVLAAALGLKSLLKWCGASRRTNRIVTWTGCILVAVVGVFAMVRYVSVTALERNFSGADGETYSVEIAPGETRRWVIHRDPLPLRVEDLLETDYEYYTYQQQLTQNSFLLDYTAYDQRQTVLDEPMAPELSYEVVDVKFGPLYDACKAELLEITDYQKEDGDLWRTVSAGDWGAEEAYQYDRAGEPRQVYVLCWPDRLVKLRLSWEPTRGQKAAAGERLAG